LFRNHPAPLASGGPFRHSFSLPGPKNTILLFEAVLADCVRLLGETHPDMRMSRNNLAAAYQAAGRSSGEQEVTRREQQ